jgi:hypothetical protein
MFRVTNSRPQDGHVHRARLVRRPGGRTIPPCTWATTCPTLRAREVAGRNDRLATQRLDVDRYCVSNIHAGCGPQTARSIQDVPCGFDRHERRIELGAIELPGNPDSAPLRKRQ